MKNNESNLFSYLIANKEFRDWVMMPNEKRNNYWKLWINENPEATGEVKKAREFIERMTFKKEQLSFDELDELLKKITADEKSSLPPRLYMQSKSSRNRNLLNTIDQWVKVAAILFIGIVSGVMMDGFLSLGKIKPELAVAEWKTVENPRGKKSNITLPDGSLVILNSGSEIKYPQFFSANQRLVELKGEAFFEVKRDEKRPFIIQTERMTTEVLGTSFNIKAYTEGENHNVAVVSGSVKVSNKFGNAKVLSANEMGLVLKDNSISKISFDLLKVTGWKDGKISFNRASFPEIQEQLSAWYGVDFIQGKGFKMDSVYTGAFENESLRNIMEGISYSSGFRYRIAGKQVFVYK